MCREIGSTYQVQGTVISGGDGISAGSDALTVEITAVANPDEVFNAADIGSKVRSDARSFLESCNGHEMPQPIHLGESLFVAFSTSSYRSKVCAGFAACADDCFNLAPIPRQHCEDMCATSCVPDRTQGTVEVTLTAWPYSDPIRIAGEDMSLARAHELADMQTCDESYPYVCNDNPSVDGGCTLGRAESTSPLGSGLFAGVLGASAVWRRRRPSKP